MYQQVENSQKALKKAEKNLKQRVRERTEEITQSNRELKAEISDRKRVEKTLRESDKTFRALIANISDVIAILDSQGIIRYESPSIKRHFGWSPEELAGTHSCDLVHPMNGNVSSGGWTVCCVPQVRRRPSAAATVQKTKPTAISS
jgi:PAS domain-containing protein